MTRATTLVLACCMCVAVAGCHSRYGPSINTPIEPAPREIDELSVRERRALLDRAHVFREIDTRSLDLLAGPKGKDAFPFDASVACAFAYPDEPLSGATPKFECEIPPAGGTPSSVPGRKRDVVKIKYGDDNGEVYAEVAASRLLWALGFFADRMYPVRIVCLNCPDDPHRASTAEWRLGRPGNVATRVIAPATIERKFEAEEIEVPQFEGWSWLELEDVADNNVGATRAHIDALKLLAAFIQHVDSKPENQGLVCPDADVVEDEEGNETCRRPLLLIKDLGSSFAAASRIRFQKMKLESWRSANVWLDDTECQANLTSSIVGTLSHPRISEEGRAFLAARLSLLSDRQLDDLFTAARVDRRRDTVDGRRATVADWVTVFKTKRDQVVNHRCAT